MLAPSLAATSRKTTHRSSLSRSDSAYGTFIAGEAHIEDHALAIAAHAQRDKDRDPHAPLADADLRIPAIHDQIPNLVLREIAAAPGLEIPGEPATNRDTASFDNGPPRSRGASAPLMRRVFVPLR
jgi:hypothetical protein